MISIQPQNNPEDMKQRILTDPVLVELLKNYRLMDEEELLLKYTLLVSSDKYKKLKLKLSSSTKEKVGHYL